MQVPGGLLLAGTPGFFRPGAEAGTACRMNGCRVGQRGLDWGMRAPVRVALVEILAQNLPPALRSVVVPADKPVGHTGFPHSL